MININKVNKSKQKTAAISLNSVTCATPPVTHAVKCVFAADYFAFLPNLHLNSWRYYYIAPCRVWADKADKALDSWTCCLNRIPFRVLNHLTGTRSNPPHPTPTNAVSGRTVFRPNAWMPFNSIITPIASKPCGSLSTSVYDPVATETCLYTNAHYYNY